MSRLKHRNQSLLPGKVRGRAAAVDDDSGPEVEAVQHLFLEIPPIPIVL